MVWVMMHDEGKIHKYVPAAQPQLPQVPKTWSRWSVFV